MKTVDALHSILVPSSPVRSTKNVSVPSLCPSARIGTEIQRHLSKKPSRGVEMTSASPPHLHAYRGKNYHLFTNLREMLRKVVSS